jgi:peptidoglycan hydrolase-like protein with peptidoglycan-binding domain
LKSQGADIYPEGTISGNFLSLTQAAVKKYQAQKGIIQTGYFGVLTRAAANAEPSR